MKRLIAVLVAVLVFAGVAHAIGNTAPSTSAGDVKIANIPDAKVLPVKTDK